MKRKVNSSNEDFQPDSVEIGNRIKALLKEKNITQKDLAEKLNFSPVSLSRWIKGDRTISLPYLKAIAKYLEVDIGYLLGDSDNPRQSQYDSEHFDTTFQIAQGIWKDANVGIISYLDSLGYSVEVVGATGDNFGGNVTANLSISVMKDIYPIGNFSSSTWNTFIGRMKKITELELNDV